MPDICSTCLSKDRTLKALHLLRKEMTLEWLQVDFLCPNSELCWECVQDLKHADRFRQRATEAQSALQGARQLCLDQSKMPLKALSTLTMSDTCQENCAQWDTPYILKKIKQNKHISLSTTDFTQSENKKNQIDIVKPDKLDTVPNVERKIKDMLEKLCNVMKKDYVKLFSIVEVTEPNVNYEPQAKKKKPLSYRKEPEAIDPEFNIMEPFVEITEPTVNEIKPVADLTEADGDIQHDTCDKPDPSYNVTEVNNVFNNIDQSKSWPVLTVGDENITLPKKQEESKLLNDVLLAEEIINLADRKSQTSLLKKFKATKTMKAPNNAQVSEKFYVNKTSSIIKYTKPAVRKIAPVPLTKLLSSQIKVGEITKATNTQTAIKVYVKGDSSKTCLDLSNLSTNSLPISTNQKYQKLMASNLKLLGMESNREPVETCLQQQNNLEGNSAKPVFLIAVQKTADSAGNPGKTVLTTGNKTVPSISSKKSLVKKTDNHLQLVISNYEDNIEVMTDKRRENITKKPDVKLKKPSKSVHQSGMPELPFTVKCINEEEVYKNRETARNDPAYVMSEFKCESCIQSFDSNDNYNKHMELNHSERSGPFICSICSTRFKREKSLKQHYKAHRRVFKCCVCSFKHHNELVISGHVKDTHQWTRCQFCDMHFISQSQLSEHMLDRHRHMSRCELRQYRAPPPAAESSNSHQHSHSQGRDKRWNTDHHQRLTLHIRSHSDVFPSTAQTAQPDELEPYVCDQCGYGTPSRATLVQHVLAAHAHGSGPGRGKRSCKSPPVSHREHSVPQ